MTQLTVNVFLSTTPLLSSQAAAKSGSFGYTASVSSNVGDGFLYWVVTANATETADTVKAGSFQAVTQIGTQAISGTGLSPNTTYRVHFLHRSASGVDSLVASTTAFVTDAIPTGGIGTVTLAVDMQMGTMVAPAAIAIDVNVAGASVSEPANAADYDPTMDGLWYHVDWGDPGAVSDKVVNLPAAHNDLNTSYAKHCSHVYTSPGTYTITATVREHDGTLVGTNTLEVVVSDPDTVFAGAATILVNAAGSGDANYPNATVVTNFADAYTAHRDKTGLSRVLFKRGETFAASGGQTEFRSTFENAYFGAYGSGADPIVAVTGATSAQLFFASWNFNADFVMTDLDIRGDWDADTETGTGQSGLRLNMNLNEGTFGDERICVNNCTFSGLTLPLWYAIELGSPASVLAVANNCRITNWADMGCFVQRNAGLHLGFIGCEIAQSENAMMGGQGKTSTQENRHGPLRFETVGKFYMAACDLFSRNTWFSNLFSQPCLRLNTAPNQYGGAYRTKNIVERTAMEGGFAVVAMTNGAGGTNTNYGTNILLDKCLMVGDGATKAIVEPYYTGVTIRNCIGVIPNSLSYPFTFGRHTFVDKLNFSSAVDSSLTPDDPVKFENNTFIVLKNTTNRNSAAIVFNNGAAVGNNETTRNNAFATVNLTGVSGAEVIDVSESAMVTVGGTWTPRFLGAKHRNVSGYGEKLTMDTSYATPAGTVFTCVPNVSSPLIGNATGGTPYDDFYGNVRSSPDRGAVERT